jgi:hypothetical protein
MLIAKPTVEQCRRVDALALYQPCEVPHLMNGYALRQATDDTNTTEHS